MDLLLALLAFVGLMAFLSTLLSVFVEGLHQTLQLRRAGLEEMLRSLHTQVLSNLNPDRNAAQGMGLRTIGDARSFAKQMTANVALGGKGMFSWVRHVPIIGMLFQRRHQNLSTLQFVEQLARTDVGAALANYGGLQLEKALTAAAYQFERFGEAQAAYFRGRAHILSVLAALVFAFAVNVDALYIFGRLYKDIGVRDEIIAVTRGVAEGNRQVMAANSDLQANVKGVAEVIEDLQARGLPVGYAAFPFCMGEVAKLDTRCVELALKEAQKQAVDARATPPTADNFVYQPETEYVFGTAWGRLMTSERSVVWVISVIAAGGLIGLGAPFWFSVFRRIAGLVPAAGSVRAALGGDSPSDKPAGAATAVRQPNVATPEGLRTAFELSRQDAVGAAAAGEIAAPDTSLIYRGDGSVVSAATTATAAPGRRQVR